MDEMDILIRNRMLGGASCWEMGGIDIAADSLSTSAV